MMRTIPVFLILASCTVCLTAQGQGMTREQIAKFLAPVQEGMSVPDHAWLVNMAGDTISFSALKGKWIVIDYWSTGCKSCLEELPAIEKFYAGADRTQLEVIRISVDSKPEQWKKSAKKHKSTLTDYYAGNSAARKINPLLAINYTVLQDGAGEKIVTLTPQYVLLSPQGVIIDKKLPRPL